MKVIQIVNHVGNEASGPTYSVVRLSQTLAQEGADVLLMTLQDGQLSPSPGFEHRVFKKAEFPARLWRSPELASDLAREASVADIVHSHGLWAAPAVYAGRACRRAHTPLVIAPRGCLSPIALRHSEWQKRVFWHVLHKADLRRARCLHATSVREYEDIRRCGLRNPVAIVPNGVDIPSFTRPAERERSEKTLLYLGRLHPIKGIDVLLGAWETVSMRAGRNWTLRIVGPEEPGYLEQLRRIVATRRLPRVEFAAPAFGDDKWREYCSADLYILPSRSENFGMTIAESLAAATPVITTKNVPWPDLPKIGCGWWVDLSVDALGQCLTDAMSLPTTDRIAMGARGRTWVAVEYAWKRIAWSMLETYTWITGGGTRPGNILLD